MLRRWGEEQSTHAPSIVARWFMKAGLGKGFVRASAGLSLVLMYSYSTLIVPLRLGHQFPHKQIAAVDVLAFVVVHGVFRNVDCAGVVDE